MGLLLVLCVVLFEIFETCAVLLLLRLGRARQDYNVSIIIAGRFTHTRNRFILVYLFVFILDLNWNSRRRTLCHSNFLLRVGLALMKVQKRFLLALLFIHLLELVFTLV